MIENGANIRAINGFGLGMLHVAAQGDSANTLYFFKNLGLDLELKDNRGSTPLHWSCFSQSEVALSYLLSWNVNFNLKDNDGYTPLHLAVKSSEEVDSTRAVKFLLIAGVKTDIRDN